MRIEFEKERLKNRKKKKSLTGSSEMMQSSPGGTPRFVNSRAAYPAATPPPTITYTNALPIFKFLFNFFL